MIYEYIQLDIRMAIIVSLSNCFYSLHIRRRSSILFITYLQLGETTPKINIGYSAAQYTLQTASMHLLLTGRPANASECCDKESDRNHNLPPEFDWQ